ncbi:hypothetical protein GQ43DRAFT_500549 [Delitschia confertaspora ATCC 74209]|uniref:MHD domain-containing protein n=1 Tax=Delitschia confertaspora ATCC 74209 TaxID=1513339 RepID=A0A9P4MUH2_9PLEO|nr:hypothetical protein GQ43DRAFT_500549 [Delitschia confertaspora ATCC 74209]
MDRKEYSALLDSLSPAQAVNVFNDRMRHVSQLNGQIADWLQERRRVEELYVQGLKKLANKHPPDESSDLGIFSIPWQKIVSATESLADSHHQLAQKIEADVERPLREFTSTNREVQNISNMSGNLVAMAKDIETSKKKADKLRDKGTKAQANKVANAVSDVEQKSQEWESQAPYIFEQLQAVDESRLNHLRDVLTQLQTHEVDQVEKHRVIAEETLNVLLNVETADEIKTWALRQQSGQKSQVGRKTSSINMPTRHLAPPPATPPPHNDDTMSQKSGSVHEQPQKHGGLQSLKRFGTVLGRRKSTHPYGRPLSPERKSSSNNLSAAFSGFGKGKGKEPVPNSPDRPVSPARRMSATPRAMDVSASPKQTRRLSNDRPNGPSTDSIGESSSSAMNGTHQTHQETILELKEDLVPPATAELVPESEKDSEGFSVPPSASDAITEAEREANMAYENPTPQFKLDIRNAPIQEEEGDADAALASLANTLRAQAAPTKRTGTLRGRRDVRNTIFVPNPASPEFTTIGENPIPPMPPLGSNNSAAFPSPGPPPQPTSPPFQISHRPMLLDHNHAASDTQSVRSGHSLSSSASTTIKHPDMHRPGLNSSLVETVSAWFQHGTVTKAMVIGQLALAYNPVDLSTPFGTETIRLENFPVLEKVAPNPAFIEQVSDSPGSYTVDLARITKTSVAFHYQVHLDPSNLATFAPVVLSPAWKTEATQTSALLHYSLNPQFALGSATSVTLRNVVLILRLEPGVQALSCQSKPVGNFSKEKGLIYWRLGDVTLSRDQPAQTLRARFFTEAEAKPGNCEARWEIVGEQALTFGSGLTVSQMSTSKETKHESGDSDPFADADGEESGRSTSVTVGWKDVSSVKKIASGTYLGV